jgi:hypothetical protein
MRRHSNARRWRFDNADSVDVVIHSYRHRLGLAPGYPPYEAIERKLAAQPVITVPAITLDGEADGNYPASDGSATAAKFRGPRPTAGFRMPVTTCRRKLQGHLPTRSLT